MMRVFKRIRFIMKCFGIKQYWRRNNQHNSTSIGRISNLETIDFIREGGVVVGDRTYGKLNINYSCGSNEKLIIGKNCSISGNCNFLLGGEHKYTCISTFPFAKILSGYPTDVLSKGPIIVEDEVWIGDGSWILSGVRLGKGSVVGAGAIVTKDTPPYSIVAGNPAKVIKMRFDDRIIKRLMDVDIELTHVSEVQVKALSEDVNADNIDELIRIITK